MRQHNQRYNDRREGDGDRIKLRFNWGSSRMVHDSQFKNYEEVRRGTTKQYPSDYRIKNTYTSDGK